MLILTEKEIQKLYTMNDCIADIEQVYHYYMGGVIQNPIRTAITNETVEGTLLYMPALINQLGAATVKVVSIYPNNATNGKKTTQGMILLTDALTGEHLALMEASYITVLRTGALSGVATKYLARKNSKTLAVIGTGGQSIGQIQAVLAVREIDHILLYNRTKQKAENLMREFDLYFPKWSGLVEVTSDVNDCVNEADIVICSTRSSYPVFNGESLKEGTHINGIGSYKPDMQEVDVTTLLKSSKVVVDTIEGALHEAGDLLIPISRGLWSFDQLHAELGEIVVGGKPGREQDEEITYFKSVGAAFFDTAVAHALYRKARENGVGTKVDM